METFFIEDWEIGDWKNVGRFLNEDWQIKVFIGEKNEVPSAFDVLFFGACQKHLKGSKPELKISRLLSLSSRKRSRTRLQVAGSRDN
jgi:hypothetical protein